MSDVVASKETPAKAAGPISLMKIFSVFLTIGATSFGGGVIAYLRNSLVRENAWLDDTEFLELMSISNTLPGLNATNMSILAGNRMRGWPGAVVAMLGMCLPGFAFMTAAGVLYGARGDNPLVTAALKGVAAAAVGLIAATWYQLGRKSVRDAFDAFVILLAVLAIVEFKLSVPIVLLGVGAIGIFHHRPGAAKSHPIGEGKWISSLQ
jgi:chromate transporter